MGDPGKKKRKPRKKKTPAKTEQEAAPTRFEKLCEKIYDLYEHVAEEQIQAGIVGRWLRQSANQLGEAKDLGQKFDAHRKATSWEQDLTKIRGRMRRFFDLGSKLEKAIVECDESDM